MRFLSRFNKTSADENEDGWLSEDEAEDPSIGEDPPIGRVASIVKVASISKAAFIGGFLMKVLKRHQSVEGDDLGIDGDLEEFSNDTTAGLGSDVDAASLLASQSSGPPESVTGGPAGDQAVAPPLSSSVSPTPVYIVDPLDEEFADATSFDRKESAMPENDGTDTPYREPAPAPAGDTMEATAPEQAATRDDENDSGGVGLSLSDIFAEEVPESNDGLRVLAESLDEVDATQLALELRSLLEELRNR